MATQSNSITGAESEMEKWRQISLCFDDIRVDLERLEMPDANVVVASTTMRVSISATTFRYAFPHLHCCEEIGVEGGKWSRVALKLLGKCIVVRGSSRFYWDNTSNRIGSVDIEGDLLTPMLSVLGNLEDVSCLFDRALLTPDFRLSTLTPTAFY
ncbi:hypothetical protein PHMEG_00013008 [Phytophthora megakarya]|uniref:Uncharacterized protein n=1 Tax=Phytophthora megakarya TaxID=4795 RepID=A0A225W7C9_9STRA|nr:hypothetical protein PHMEG_00013008 [Phytophthora megakarya]